MFPLAIFVGVLLVILMMPEIRQAGLEIDPVAILVADLKAGPTPEQAQQRIASEIDRIRRKGVLEFSRLYVDQAPDPTQERYAIARELAQSTSPAGVPIEIQVPGLPFSFRASLRQIAALFSLMRPTIQASIVSQRAGALYVASICVVRRDGTRECEAPVEVNNYGDAFERIALTALTITDPKIAASYRFGMEQGRCRKLDPSELKATVEVQIATLRERCGFKETQSLVAKAITLDWWAGPYIIGKIHLLRAMAFENVDPEQQIAEFNQAIERFGEAAGLQPDPHLAAGALVGAYIQEGITIHESVRNLEWRDDFMPKLAFAEKTFKEASKKLDELSSKGGKVDKGLRALLLRLDALLYYRQWVLKSHRRTKLGRIGVAIGSDERRLLEEADRRFANAANDAPLSASMYLHWGNVLRAKGDFSKAIEKYEQAAYLDPEDYAPYINTATAHLLSIADGPTPAPAEKLLNALRSSSNYLFWVSEGGPYPDFIARIKAPLDHTGSPDDVLSFQQCVKNSPADPLVAAEHKKDQMPAVAALKQCIDRAIDRINQRTAEDQESR